MKKLGVVIATVAAAGLGSYVALSFKAESHINSLVLDANKSIALSLANSPARISFSLENYSRGVFSSHADLQIKAAMVMPSISQQNSTLVPVFTYNFPLKISQGPFIFSNKHFGFLYAEAELPLPNKLQNNYDKLFSQNSIAPRMLFNTFVKFDGRSQLGFKIPPFKLIDNQKKSDIGWQGFEADWHVAKDFHAITGKSKFSGLVFNDSHVRGDVGKVSMNFSMHKGQAGLWLGDGSVDFPSVHVKSNDQLVLSLDGGKFKSSTGIELGLFNMDMLAKLGKVTFNGKTFGPGNLDLVVRRLNPESLSKLQTLLSELSESDLSVSAKERKLQQMIPEFVKLVAKGAVVELSNLQFKLPDGLIRARAKLSVPDGIDESNPQLLINKLAATATFTVPSRWVKTTMVDTIAQKMLRMKDNHQGGNTQAKLNSLAGSPVLTENGSGQAEKQAAEQLDSLLNAKFILVDGDNYKVNLELKKGEIFVNGLPYSSSK